MNDLELKLNGGSFHVSSMDVSAGGMKLVTGESLNIDGNYDVTLPLSESVSLDCKFQPIRIERRSEGGYTVSGQFIYNSNHDKMILTQYCAKRSVEIKNK
jgi:c-di-GMP-binding flagellar brake protein YcgR